MSTTIDLLPFDPAHGLGRHVEHDDRSLSYLVPRTVDTFNTVYYKTHTSVPILDQGSVGACTGFALAGLLGKAAYYGDLRDKVGVVNNQLGLDLYHENTLNDSIPGTYPPNDTGSTGLAAGKTAKKRGYISEYKHITSASALATALRTNPVLVGTKWYNSMMRPQNGLLTVNPSSGLAGGHEYVLDEVTADGRFGFLNSWGGGFGVSGRMYMRQADFLSLLADQGDATYLVAVQAPAPTPVPPTPTPDVVDSDVLAAYHSLQKWAQRNGRA